LCQVLVKPLFSLSSFIGSFIDEEALVACRKKKKIVSCFGSIFLAHVMRKTYRIQAWLQHAVSDKANRNVVGV
jgi:hypothetical protein